MAWSKYSVYLAFDQPVPYRDGKLLLYPVLLKDYYYFYYYAQCLLVDKNTEDPTAITMKEFEYLVRATNEKNLYLPLFYQLMKLVLRQEDLKIDFVLDERDKKPAFKIGDEVYTWEDYLEIKLIIAEQNDLELPDLSLSKEIRDEMEKQRQYRAKLSGTKWSALEDLMVCVTTATAISLDELYKMTIRKFNKLVQRTNELIDYKIYKTAANSGMVQYKDKNFPYHWMRDLETNDKFGGLALSLDDAKNKISADGKINMG
jgi:hypothetical protein